MVDRFGTGRVDLSGDCGLFTQVNGRTSKVLMDWLALQDPEWPA
jgi:transposase